MTGLLIIEDNASFAMMLAATFRREGFDVEVAAGGTAGLALARSSRPDLVILDLMLPTMGGASVLQRLRDDGDDVPILVFSALGSEHEKLRAFALGADDYVIKPCGVSELLARVRVLLRRTRGREGLPATSAEHVDLRVDFANREVRRGDESLMLRPKEFELFVALLRHRGATVSREDLLREVWGYAGGSRSRTLDTHLAELRQHLGRAPDGGHYVETVRRIGYRLVHGG